MRKFRFRAQAALDLRQREYDLASSRNAAARSAADLAGAAVSAAEQALIISLTRAQQAATTLDMPYAWHRNWIVGLRQEIARRKSVQQIRHTEAVTAQEQAHAAYRRVRSLEQLRTRLEQAHAAEQQHIEQLELDEFNSLRFASRQVREEEAR